MNILVVDDEREIADVIELYLHNDQYNVFKFYTGEDALACIGSKKIDLAILDIMLPDIDGFQLLKMIREKYTFPVIMLTAKTEYMDKITGLTLGADDYISKPFRPRELVSRMRSVLRRAGKFGGAVQVGGLKVDMEKGAVFRAGEELFLSALEYRLFLVFLNHRGKILSRGQLLEEIWDVVGEYVNDNTLTVYIKRLRDKIELDPQNPEIIKTVRGMGYRMEA